MIALIFSSFVLAHAAITPERLYFGPESGRFVLIEADQELWDTVMTSGRAPKERYEEFKQSIRLYVGPADALRPRRVVEVSHTRDFKEWHLQMQSARNLRFDDGPTARLTDQIIVMGGEYYEVLNRLEFDPETLDRHLTIHRGHLEATRLDQVCGPLLGLSNAPD